MERKCADERNSFLVPGQCNSATCKLFSSRPDISIKFPIKILCNLQTQSAPHTNEFDIYIVILMQKWIK